jgi:hypothetical protein
MTAFTYSEVKEILREVFETYKLTNSDEYKMRFEKRLNDRGLNGNNGDNEDKEELFFEDEIESFIY